MTQQELNYFNRFLEMHGAKEKYWKNVENAGENPPQVLGSNAISSEFVWSETPQGYSYWADLKTAFRVFLKKHPFNPKSRPLPIPQRPFSFYD